MPIGGQLALKTANINLDEEQARILGTDLEPGHYLELQVSDTGHGMAEDIQARLFDPFFTTKGTTKTPNDPAAPALNRGAGLGLAETYGVVKNMGAL